MEKLVNKLRQSSIFAFIMLLLAATWLVLDYFVIQSIIYSYENIGNLEIIILKASMAMFAVFILAVVVLLYYVFRIRIKIENEFNLKAASKKNEETFEEEEN